MAEWSAQREVGGKTASGAVRMILAKMWVVAAC